MTMERLLPQPGDASCYVEDIAEDSMKWNDSRNDFEFLLNRLAAK